MRRERKKNVERERQIEEKAQFFSKEYCDRLRDRMMEIDRSKIDRVVDSGTGGEGSEAGKIRESEMRWIGGRGSDSARAGDMVREKAQEQGKKRMSSWSVIERNMADVRNGAAEGGGVTGSPVSILTDSLNASREGDGTRENSSNDKCLTALPTES